VAGNSRAGRAALGSAIVCGAFISTAFADARIELSTGSEYSSGDFGGNLKTSVWYTPFSARIATGNWSFRVTVPYLSITAPADVIVLLADDPTVAGAGGGTTLPTTPAAPNRTVSGIGDIPVAATYSFNHIGGSQVYADLGARVRFPTGDRASGIGVGATDYAFQTAVGIDLDAGGAYVSAGRRILGRVPGLERVDGWQAGAGASVDLGTHAVIGAYYDWRDASEKGFPEPREVGTYLSVRMSRAWKIRFDASTELAQGGRNYTVGMMVFWRTLPRR
jgi:hypothetical protein